MDVSPTKRETKWQARTKVRQRGKTRRVSFTNRKGGGRAARISTRETDPCTFLAKLFIELRPRFIDEFYRARDRLGCCRNRYLCRELLVRLRIAAKTSLSRTRQMREWRKVLLCTGEHAEHRDTRPGVSSQSRNYQRNLSIVILRILLNLIGSLTCSNNTCVCIGWGVRIYQLGLHQQYGLTHSFTSWTIDTWFLYTVICNRVTWNWSETIFLKHIYQHTTCYKQWVYVE